VFERAGFTFKKRTGGSHWVGEKPGVARPIVLPEYEEVGLDIIKANLRTAGLTRQEYVKLLSEC
jgi:hypothetical protein